MFTAEPRNDALETLELRDTEARSLLVLAPARGGMATRLSLGGRHRFFLDESTLRDPSKNVRGGNPVLFPSPGKLEDDRYERDGHEGSLGQHGFARSLPWEVVSTATEGAAAATLRLSSSDATRGAYPWEFVAEYKYILRGKVLRIEQRFSNAGGEPMPFGAGFHPYFHVKQADKGAARIGTSATRAFDNVTKKDVELSQPLSLTRKEVDLHLLDHGARPCTLSWPGTTLVVRGSPEYTHWVVWTLQGKDFVCVEPWTCPGNALNTGDRLLTVAPGETRELWVEYEAS
ncbi:MAG TPA: galactose mutarotase [Polyangiaceae bacterium]|nr:galactose mutarotase [Polyangiaceae bacterium]